MSQLLYTVRPALTSTAAPLIPRDAITSGTDWNSAAIHNTSASDVTRTSVPAGSERNNSEPSSSTTPVASGEFGEMERFMKTLMNKIVSQRNDYLMWINNAKREATKQKRLDQMLDELERGGVYMRMEWNG